MLRRLLALLLPLAYPFVVLWGLRAWGVGFLCAAVSGMGFAQWALTRTKTALAGFAASLFLCGLALLAGDAWLLKLYPVFVNAAMLALFGHSLLSGQSFIEKLARLSNPHLPPEAVRYTRRLTVLWCCFFILNGSAALWTALHPDDALWAFYNGFLSYVLIGALMGGEWLWRRFVLKV